MPPRIVPKVHSGLKRLANAFAKLMVFVLVLFLTLSLGIKQPVPADARQKSAPTLLSLPENQVLK